MRIKVEFSSENMHIVLPLNYNRLIQGLIYGSISNNLSTFLHNKGYELYKRSFKLFTFSRIFGKYNISFKNIIFNSPICFYLSSPYDDILEEFANSMFKNSSVFSLGLNKIYCSSIAIDKNFDFESNKVYKIKMLSPVTTYSTHILNGKKKTIYYGPYDREFSKLIHENLKKKYLILNKKEIKKNNAFNIKPLEVDPKKNFIVTSFKGTIIKGWMGNYEISGDNNLLKIAYDTGIGSKNSAGFGMWSVIDY